MGAEERVAVQHRDEFRKCLPRIPTTNNTNRQRLLFRNPLHPLHLHQNRRSCFLLFRRVKGTKVLSWNSTSIAKEERRWWITSPTTWKTSGRGAFSPTSN